MSSRRVPRQYSPSKYRQLLPAGLESRSVPGMAWKSARRGPRPSRSRQMRAVTGNTSARLNLLNRAAGSGARPGWGGGGRESSPEAPGARAFISYYFIFGPVSCVRRREEQIGASGAPGSILIDWERGVSTWRFHVTDVPSDSHLSFIIRAPPFP